MSSYWFLLMPLLAALGIFVVACIASYLEK